MDELICYAGLDGIDKHTLKLIRKSRIRTIAERMVAGYENLYKLVEEAGLRNGI